MTALLLFSLLSASFWYLLSQATITSWLWRRYPASIDRFMSCSACTGFWLGLGCGALNYHWLHLSFLGVPPDHLAMPGLVAFTSIVTTPIVARLQVEALLQLSAPASPDGEEDARTDP